MPKEADWPDSPFFAFLDERAFLTVALLSLTIFLMAFLDGIIMTERIESFHRKGIKGEDFASHQPLLIGAHMSASIDSQLLASMV